MNRSTIRLLPFVFLFLAAPGAAANDSFVNWETPHVHPLDITPSGTRLLAVNTADNRLEVFDIQGGTPVHLGSVPVGLGPVSVRARNDNEVWVVNHVSDSVSIVDLAKQHVIRTVGTDDEPADVVFAGTPERAFVSCSQANKVQVFDPADRSATPVEIELEAEDPRAMAVSPDGAAVYVAVFESGNGSTILGGGSELEDFFPPDVVSDPLGPYGGVNPPPNDGADFDPPLNPANPMPPPVGLTVKRNDADRWVDDNRGDWTSLVSGFFAEQSGRPIGWDLLDYDLARIDADTLDVTYATGLMNLCMAVAVNPATGHVAVVGTDATNEIRFEPKLNGRFLRVNLALVDPAQPDTPAVVDLNPHLTYASPSIPAAEREQSLGDPRGIVWNAAGTRGYVSGMGSDNVVVVDAAGARAGLQPTVEVGEGPTGVVLDEVRNRLYVLNKFAASISVVDTQSESEVARVSFYDPSPAAIKIGRRHLYGTHETSGTGHVSCASCHADARMDRLAWDLGNPAGDMKTFNQNCNMGNNDLGPGPCEDWHPMKGPMVTQTLQDIIGKEPHHWRGDRDGLEEFNQTFTNLQGAEEELTPQEMQEFEDFLATIHLPPNPFRDFDNTLPSVLPLPGHYTTGIDLPPGLPLPDGRPNFGVDQFFGHHLVAGFVLECTSCHSTPTGMGVNANGGVLIPPGPNGELHHGVVFSPSAETTNISIKVPQLRNMHEKVGFDMLHTTSRAGFGYLHDGSVDTLERFMSLPAFDFEVGLDDLPDQLVADMVALMLTLSGSALPSDPGNPAIPFSKDVHAAVGAQLTVDDTNQNDPAVQDRLDEMIAVADAVPAAFKPGPEAALVAKGFRGGLQRGFAHMGGNLFWSDRAGETISADALRSAAGTGAEITFTVVPEGSELRIGIDRDEDGSFDRDELDACSDPADAASLPGADVTPVEFLLLGLSETGLLLSWSPVGASWDVVRGDLNALRASGGDYSVAVEDCVGENVSAPSLPDPDIGGSPNVFFLVSAACAGGATYDSGGSGQVEPRDNEIGAAAAACQD